MKAVIAIASILDKGENRELPVARVYSTKEGEYLFLERKTLEKAIALSLEDLEAGKKSVVLVRVEVVPISERGKRSRRLV